MISLTLEKKCLHQVLSKNQCFAGLFLLTKTIKNVVTLNKININWNKMKYKTLTYFIFYFVNSVLKTRLFIFMSFNFKY